MPATGIQQEFEAALAAPQAERDVQMRTVLDHVKTIREERVAQLTADAAREKEAYEREIDWWTKAIPVDIIGRLGQEEREDAQRTESKVERERWQQEDARWRDQQLREEGADRAAMYVFLAGLVAAAVGPFFSNVPPYSVALLCTCAAFFARFSLR